MNVLACAAAAAAVAAAAVARRRCSSLLFAALHCARSAAVHAVLTPLASSLRGRARHRSKFSDVPGDLAGAYFGIPLLGWVQIMALIAALDIAVFRQVTHDADDPSSHARV